MHNLHSSSDDDENDLKEFSFPQEAVLQQASGLVHSYQEAFVLYTPNHLPAMCLFI